LNPVHSDSRLLIRLKLLLCLASARVNTPPMAKIVGPRVKQRLWR
jgi:hypothetical protein